jgi:Mn-dependent DtxR family transcriptional regulator
MSNSDATDDISTTVSELAERLGVSENRVTEAAKTTLEVYGWQTGMIEATEQGLDNLKAAINSQFN